MSGRSKNEQEALNESSARVLREFLQACPLSMQYIADYIKITRMSLYNKMNGFTAFTATEALRLKDVTGMDSELWNRIFRNLA